MARPRRLYINSKEKYYYIVNGVKKFIKVPQGMSQQQIQNINIKNIIAGPARRLKRRTKKIVPVYSKKIAKGEDMEKSVIKAESGLPTYIFTPQKKFLSLGDLSTKSDDTSTDKLINLLKGAIPVIAEGAKKLALPAPESKSQVSEDIQNYMKIIAEARKTLEEAKAEEEIDRQKRLEEIDRQKRLKEIESEVPTSAGKRGRKPGTKVEEGYSLNATAIVPLLKQLENEGRNLNNVTPGELQQIYARKGGKKTITSFGVIEARKILRKQKEATPISSVEGTPLRTEGSGADNGDDGLYNDQIEKIMKKRIKNFVPVVASDKVNDLLQYVNKGDKFFSAVINTEPSESFGRHWRCIVIDNRDDYPSAEYFDSLAENAKPDDALLSVMRKICKRMNSEKYFKFKYNMLRRQSFNTSNCSYHVMKFIEDRHNGVPFEDASGWSDYMKRQKGNGYEAIDDSQDGEGDLEKYQNKIKKLFKSYL
jgi:hypothetical protein